MARHLFEVAVSQHYLIMQALQCLHPLNMRRMVPASFNALCCLAN